MSAALSPFQLIDAPDASITTVRFAPVNRLPLLVSPVRNGIKLSSSYSFMSHMYQLVVVRVRRLTVTTSEQVMSR